MNDRARALLDLVRPAAEEYARELDAGAIVVTGSIARGEPDEHSDADVCVLLNQMCSAERFQAEKARAEASGGGLYGGDETQGFGLWRVIGGAKCDFGFGTVEGYREIFADVIERQDLTLDKQLMIDGLRRSIVLHGEEVVRELAALTEPYPDALAEAMVREHLRQRPIWVLRGMGAERGEALFVREELLAMHKRLLAVLYGLNRQYHPGKLKGSSANAPRLDITPPRLFERLEWTLRAGLLEAVDEAERLVLEIYDLVDAYLPSIDTAPARERFAMDHSWKRPAA